MSNYAPDPKKESIYSALAQKTLSDVTAGDIELQTDPVFIQAANQDALLTFNTINQAAFRDGLPMPNTGEVKVYTQTSDANCAEIRPPKGEVWKIQGISIRNTVTPTGNNNYYTFLSDPTSLANSPAIPSINNLDLYYSVLASASSNLPTESVFEEVFQPFVISHNMFIRMWSDFDNAGSGNEVKYMVGYVNLR